MKTFIRCLCALATLGLIGVLVAVPALAGVRPSVTALSSHRGTYWGGAKVTVYGHNFTHVKKVMFGARRGTDVHVLSSRKLTVHDPVHKYGSTYIRVVTGNGWSAKSSANKFTFTHPTMNSHIQGGLTARQEQSISARVRRAHHGVYTAHRSSRWTSAMGISAVMRARSWLGLPYSWAGGNSRGPTTGVCAHNGGDMDCHIIGFDCSGLTLYSWAPYVRLAHFAATQRGQAGRFHPAIGQLVPGDLVFFSSGSGSIGHTAIYEGHGNVIQAEQSGYVVMRTPLRSVIAFSGRYRGATRPTSTGKQAPGPRLTSITPQVSTRGGSITINGSYLSTATTVVVAGKTYYSFAKRTSSQLVVRIPSHRAGKVSVAVSNPWGTAGTATSYITAPTVSALSPATGPTTGGTAVTLTGANLTRVSRVTVGSTPVAFHVLAANRLGFTMPAHAPGAVSVYVTTPSGTSAGKAFTYVTPTPGTSASRTAPPSTTSAPPTTSAPTSGSGGSSTSAPPTGAPTTSVPPSSPSTTPAPAPTPSGATTSGATTSGATTSGSSP